MSVTAAQVNDLRKATGAGLMDCKKALMETGGDMHCDVLDKGLEIFVLGHEIGFAVYFNKHPYFTPGVYVRTYDSFGGDPSRLFGRTSGPSTTTLHRRWPTAAVSAIRSA